MKKSFSIGQIANACQCKVQTLRYYEEVGLIPKPERNAGNQRIYNANQLKRVKFIRHSRQLGFSLEQIRQILALTDNPNQPCDKVNDIAKSHLDEVSHKIKCLQDLQSELQRMVSECSANRVADCRVVEILSDHELCNQEHENQKLTSNSS
ncbi:MAG TPA: MerR family transcriptional regulator [Thiomicrospira sp.]|nr:MerR family transcriptional regulator [Thiomicrospira sp.]